MDGEEAAAPRLLFLTKLVPGYSETRVRCEVEVYSMLGGSSLAPQDTRWLEDVSACPISKSSEL